MTRQAARAKTGSASAPNNALSLERRGSLGPHLTVQREATAAPAAPAAAMVRDAVRSPGQPLDSGARREMEARFGHDLSAVRLHTGDEAAQSARAVGANAYTSGPDIVFGEGQYQPGSPSGRRLLAHELTHVIQQGSGPVAGTRVDPQLAVSSPDDAFERQAEGQEDRTTPAAEADSPLPAGPADSEDLHIQRDFLGLSGDAWGGIGAIGGGAALALGVLAYLRPPEALNPAPVTGGLTLNPNPFSFSSMQAPVTEPASNRPRYQQALRGRPQEHQILDLRTDDDNHLAVNLALKTDGYNILDASVRTGETQGYLGGSRGSSAALNFSAAQVAVGASANFFAPEPGQATPASGAPTGGSQGPANAQPQGAAGGASPTTSGGQQQGAAPGGTATTEPAEMILTFTGSNAKNQGNPQNFAGQITVKGDGTVRADDCRPTNGVGRAEAAGERGVIDYRAQPSASGGGFDLGGRSTPSPDGGRFDPTQVLPFGRPMT